MVACHTGRTRRNTYAVNREKSKPNMRPVEDEAQDVDEDMDVGEEEAQARAGAQAQAGERCETNPRVNLISDRLNRINFHLTHESKTG